jgi:hypothetical protein
MDRMVLDAMPDPDLPHPEAAVMDPAVRLEKRDLDLRAADVAFHDRLRRQVRDVLDRVRRRFGAQRPELGDDPLVGAGREPDSKATLNTDNVLSVSPSLIAPLSCSPSPR